MAVKASKLTVSLPFEIGKLEFEPDEAQQKAAWSLYVEMVTRAAIQPLDPQQGLLREVLESLYSMFALTRQILREAGPGVAKGDKSLGWVAIEVLNKGLRPFLTTWHPRLMAHEQSRAEGMSQLEHERQWVHYKEMRQELVALQRKMRVYAAALLKIAGAKTPEPESE